MARALTLAVISAAAREVTQIACIMYYRINCPLCSLDRVRIHDDSWTWYVHGCEDGRHADCLLKPHVATVTAFAVVCKTAMDALRKLGRYCVSMAGG